MILSFEVGVHPVTDELPVQSPALFIFAVVWLGSKFAGGEI